jgi:peptide/nickel transport system substrate-binding protein
MVAGPSLAILDRHLQAAAEGSFVPFAGTLGILMRDGEVGERYDALRAWRADRDHYWVSDGPFYLHAVYPLERVLVLRRYEDFPDPSDKWLRFITPEIPELVLDGPMIVPADQPAEFTLQVTFGGEPYPEEALATLQYLLFDGTGKLVRKGDAARMDDGQWLIRLAPRDLAALGVGANSLEVAVTSNRVALPSFASHAFATVPSWSVGVQ